MVIHINKLDAGFDFLLELNKNLNSMTLIILVIFVIQIMLSDSPSKKNHKSELIGLFDKTALTIGNCKIYMLPPPGGFFQATQFAEKVILDEIFLNIRKTKNLKILDFFQVQEHSHYHF